MVASGLESEPEREVTMADTALIVGSGEHRVLALHGWFGSARGWGSLPDYLNGDDYTWAFMDLRGYGSRKDVAGSQPNHARARLMSITRRGNPAGLLGSNW